MKKKNLKPTFCDKLTIFWDTRKFCLLPTIIILGILLFLGLLAALFFLYIKPTYLDNRTCQTPAITTPNLNTTSNNTTETNGSVSVGSSSN